MQAFAESEARHEANARTFREQFLKEQAEAQVRRLRRWLLARHSRRHRKQIERRYKAFAHHRAVIAAYMAMSDREKADHYWKGRGL